MIDENGLIGQGEFPAAQTAMEIDRGFLVASMAEAIVLKEISENDRVQRIVRVVGGVVFQVSDCAATNGARAQTLGAKWIGAMIGTKNVVQERPIGADDNDDEKETKEPYLIAEHLERGEHGFEHAGV